MKLKTVINGKEKLHCGVDARTKLDAREYVMTLGLCMLTDPICDEGCWKIHCMDPRKAA